MSVGDCLIGGGPEPAYILGALICPHQHPEPAMGLFYAYLKDAGYDHCYRKVITFVNREVADEWWRMISAPSSSYAGHVRRVSPQFYIQDNTPDHDVSDSTFFYCAFPDGILSNEKMFFSYISDKTERTPIPILPTDITDHISGGWYFIRSKADPFSHWYLRIHGICLVCGDANCDAVHVSSEYRTRFCIRARNTAGDLQVPENFVMIGRDEISIATSKGYMIHISDVGDLKATKGYAGETDLLFGDLKKRFISRAEKQVNGEVWEYVESVERGVGETWELVE